MIACKIKAHATFSLQVVDWISSNVQQSGYTLLRYFCIMNQFTYWNLIIVKHKKNMLMPPPSLQETHASLPTNF